eukprot:TRINITY_DN20811_c0_g1_i1.p1 TRINITY_DN20811_c0_g1~~TRINITY_DN20811_c0_g1_i1.p1  ORF type:complete len:623 (+),score=50.09 TRINITY_DN20811_c0_g1_i1:185-2053(+)
MLQGQSPQGTARVQWEFDGGHHTWQRYSEASQRELEMQYRDWELAGRCQRKRKFQLNIGAIKYDIDLELSEQTNAATRRVRKMRRREQPLDPITSGLQQRVQQLETQLTEARNENVRLRRSLTHDSNTSASSLSVFQDRFRVFRSRETLPRFSSPSDSALRQNDLPAGSLVIAVQQHMTVTFGTAVPWLELVCGGFIKEHHTSLEPCEEQNMESQCSLLREALTQSRPARATACICIAESSPLACQPDYVARLSLSCCNPHGRSSSYVEKLERGNVVFDFVHRIFHRTLVQHPVRYGSSELAERPKMEIAAIYRICNPDLLQKYDIERREIVSRRDRCMVPQALKVSLERALPKYPRLCSGVFHLCSFRWQGHHVWQNSDDNRLHMCSLTGGRWTIGEKYVEADKVLCRSFMRSEETNIETNMPTKMKTWCRFDDSGRWIEDAGFKIQDVTGELSVAPQAEYVLESSSSGLIPSTQEFFLWHGTRPEIAKQIESDGFDPRRGGSFVGKMFGVGTYLAEHASKSDLYGDGDPKGNAQGREHCLLFVKALLGRAHYTKIKLETATKPPDDSDGKPLDSVVALTEAEGGCVKLREYIVYKPTQVLPLCRVVYRHLPECKCCRCIR